MMSSDLVMVLYVQSLKHHQCSIAKVMAQQGIKATKMTMNGDVSEGGEFLEPLEKAKLFVENLVYDANSQTLAMLFEKVGTVGASLV
ncbi:hypothetical protein F2Q69_00011216 [Brassica cretica]|uniref:Uncharacterized protein n=1 Tax=Brassica cretica TaxID=69181 RepID=A0A8S9QKC3_BRACR|nr:hypothetical protein F2Q69_00011216 [Brassica cretica]